MSLALDWWQSVASHQSRNPTTRFISYLSLHNQRNRLRNFSTGFMQMFRLRSAVKKHIRYFINSIFIEFQRAIYNITLKYMSKLYHSWIIYSVAVESMVTTHHRHRVDNIQFIDQFVDLIGKLMTLCRAPHRKENRWWLLYDILTCLLVPHLNSLSKFICLCRSDGDGWDARFPIDKKSVLV